MSDGEEIAGGAPRGRWLRLALAIAISAAILALLARHVDVDDVGAVLLNADPAGLGAGLGLYALLQSVRAVRYKLLAPAASMRVLLGVHAVHALLLRVMPMRTGELGFAWLMRRSGAGGFSDSLVGVALVRILDLAAVLAVFSVALVLFSGTFRADAEPSIALVVGVGAVAALAPLYVAPLLVLSHRALESALALTGMKRFARVARGSRALAAAVEAARQIRRRVLWQVTGLTIVQWGINFALIWVLLEAMGLHVSPAQAVLGGTGSVFGGLLPLAGVGNFGPLEAGWALGFAAVGVPTEQAVASGFGFSVISFTFSALTAVAGWLALPAARGGTKAPRDLP